MVESHPVEPCPHIQGQSWAGAHPKGIICPKQRCPGTWSTRHCRFALPAPAAARHPPAAASGVLGTSPCLGMRQSTDLEVKRRVKP